MQGLSIVTLLAIASTAFAQGNGHLQLHFMNVGQGDGTVLITPGGQSVLFDNGVVNQCSRPVTYLQRLGVSRIDYHIASHYHADHIGCTEQVFAVMPLQHLAFDRGGSYTTQTYNRYVAAVGNKRQTAPVGTTLSLEGGVSLDFVAANGAGVVGADDENDLSVAVRVRYGGFDAVIAGDLSGVNGAGYADVESTVAPLIGRVEVYRVNHHASRYSSNANWLNTLRPKVGIVSMGANNSFCHPTADAMTRLHAVGVRTYWTSVGNGVAPDPSLDVVGGDIVIDVPPNSESFTVQTAGQTHAYGIWGAQITPPGAPQTLSGSANGSTVTLNWLPPTTGGVPTSYIVEASAVPGGAAIASVPVAGTTLPVPNVPNGIYYVRVRATNAYGQSAPSNEVTIVVPGGGGGCGSPPNAPQGLIGSAAGSLVSLSWNASAGGCSAAAFTVQAGNGPGASNIAQVNVGSVTNLSASAPFGTYYIRVVATNAYGQSLPSNELTLVVGASCQLPGMPNAPSAAANGSLVSIIWQAPTTGGPATQYRVQAGSVPGASDRLDTIVMGATSFAWSTAPSGTSYVRVTAINSCGSGAASPDTSVTVGPSCPLPGAPMLLSPSVSGTTVALSWIAPGGAISFYQVEAGSSSGASNLLNTTTSATSYTWSGAPTATSYIRVRAVNSCASTGPTSNEVTATVSSGGGGGNTCTGPISAPCGQATARCRDGTYSCSQNRSGTCSSHGGVSCWICPGRLCSGDFPTAPWEMPSSLSKGFGLR